MNYLEQYMKNSPLQFVKRTTPPKENKTSKADNTPKNPFNTKEGNISPLAFAGIDALCRASIRLNSKKSNKTPENGAKNATVPSDKTVKEAKEVSAEEVLARSKNLSKEAEVIYDRSDKVKEEAYTVLSDAQDLVKTTIAKIESDPKNLTQSYSIYTETQGDKTIKTFYDVKNGKAFIESIEIDKANGLKDRIYFDTDYNIQTIGRNIRISDDKSEEIGEEYWFYKGELSIFNSGIHLIYSNGIKRKIGEAFNYFDGKLFSYNINHEILPDETHKYGKRFDYDSSNGKLRTYNANRQILPFNRHKVDETFEYWDGSLEKYTADKKLLPEIEDGADLEFRFKGDKLIDNSKP